MKKIIILILMINILSSCNISLFGKLNHFGLAEAYIDSRIELDEISVIGDERTLTAYESNQNTNLSTTIVVDLDSIATSFISGGSSLYPDDWSYLPSPEEQSGLPIFSLLHLLGLFSYQDLTYVGGHSFNGSFEGVSYFFSSNSYYVDSMTFSSGTAYINGWEEDFFNTSMLEGGTGELIRIDFEIGSDNDYLDGTGVMLISSGIPNGLVYLYYDHSTDYTSVAYQEWGSGTSGLFFDAPYDGNYGWYTIRDGHEL
jgi:hypothetical protein